MKIMLLPMLLLGFLAPSLTLDAETKVVPSTSKTYRYHFKINYRKIKPGQDLQYVYCPLPPSNDYQIISDIDTHGGEILNNRGSVEKYVRYTISPDQQPAQGEWGTCLLEFNYTPTRTEYVEESVSQVFEYDTASDVYQRYTKNYYEFFDTNNSKIKKISDDLWSQSEDIHDYSKKCYQYTIDNFNFQNNPGRWNPLNEIIDLNGGDCGNLSSIFITLLRRKKIPARHVIAYRHAWAEFYMEGYG